MTRRALGRALTAGLVMLLVQGCATPLYALGDTSSLAGGASPSGGGPLVPDASTSEEARRAETGARQAEIEWALTHMGALAQGEAKVGAELEFAFWVERGAFRRHFARWFNQRYEPSQSDVLLKQVTVKALDEVRILAAG